MFLACQFLTPETNFPLFTHLILEKSKYAFHGIQECQDSVFFRLRYICLLGKHVGILCV